MNSLILLDDRRRRAAREAERSQRLARFGRRLDRAAKTFGWIVIVFAVGYFTGAIIAAWLSGAFQAVAR